jgi:ribosomal-protein-alanine N-acetyltransferase
MTHVVCETDRLILRHFTADDLGALAAIHSDPEVTRFFGGTRTPEQTRARLADFLRDYERLGFAKWAVVLRSTGELIGRCGPAIEHVDGTDEVEIGYDLAKQHWGRGLATEAAAAAVEHCFVVLGRPRVISLIDPRNVASQRVAQHIGMTYERDVEWRKRPIRLYSKEVTRSRHAG